MNARRAHLTQFEIYRRLGTCSATARTTARMSRVAAWVHTMSANGVVHRMAPRGDVLDCPSCGRAMVRTHRTALQRLIYRAAFRCPHCDRCVKHLHRPEEWVLVARRRLSGARDTRCVRCGSSYVRRLSHDDPENPKFRPFRAIIAWMGIPLKKCDRCLHTYYDWRVSSLPPPPK
jgi:hypothetical protein